MRTSDFLGIGVQKGGTTTLHHWLSSHPDVYMPERKETHYYTLNYHRGLSWYAAQFEGARANQVTGEITPYYCFHPYAVSRSEKDNNRRKYILLLRDPVERTLSQYFHSKRLGLEPLPLEEALAAESTRMNGAHQVLEMNDGLHKSHQEHSYVSRSRYEQQLVRMQPIHGEGRLLIMQSENLFQMPEASWQRILYFLGLRSTQLENTQLNANAGSGEAVRIKNELRRALRKELEPTYQYLERNFGIIWSVNSKP